MPEKVYRTAIYCRLSREDGDRLESNSIASQRSICEDYIAYHSDLELVKEPFFIDDGCSGVTFDRPKFRELEALVKAGDIECIVCKDLSRFARNYIDAGRYLEKVFPQIGVRFIAVNDAYDSLTGDPQSDSFVVPFKNLINDAYCKDISMKVRSSLTAKQKDGQFVGCFAPYGYQKAPDNRNQLMVDEGAGETVRTIFMLYKDGFSVGRIADRLNQMGVLSPMEHKRSMGIRFETVFKTGVTTSWGYNTVRRILTNEVYLGVLTQGKRSRPNHKVRVTRQKEESDWVRVENTHEALVSYEDFAAVQEMLHRDMRCAPEKSEVHPLSGFLFCADCGRSMACKSASTKNRKYVYFVCSSYRRSNGCSSHSISEKKLEEAVLQTIHDQIELVIHLDKALALIAELPSQNLKASGYEAQIVKLEEEIERYQRMKLRLYEDLSDGIISKTDYADFRNHYTKAIEEKQDAILRVKKEQQIAVSTGTTERNWVTLFKQYENIEALDRRVLMALVDRILVYENSTIEIVFKYRDEYQQALEYVHGFSELLEIAG